VASDRVDLRAADTDPLPPRISKIRIYDPIHLNYAPSMVGYDPKNYQVTLGPWTKDRR